MIPCYYSPAKRGRHPLLKTAFANPERGVIPITKNIRVIDAQGNEHEATYLKRAKGLVKKGRARFISENTLYLACPPLKMEDNMENINKNMAEWAEQEDPRSNGPRPQAEPPHTPEPPEPPEMSLSWLMSRMDAIIQNTQYITDAMEAVRDIEVEGGHDIAAKSKADTIRQIIQSREDTNRQTLQLLEKMYKDLTRPTTNRLTAKEMGIDWEDLLHDLPPQEKLALFREVNGL